MNDVDNLNNEVGAAYQFYEVNLFNRQLGFNVSSPAHNLKHQDSETEHICFFSQLALRSIFWSHVTPAGTRSIFM